MDQMALKLFVMVVLTIFSFWTTAFGAWLTNKALRENHENAGVAAIFAFVATGGLLYAIATIAGVQLK